MTTILAIVSAVLFFKQSAYFLFALIVFFVIIQSITKRIMNNLVKKGIAEGFSAIDATEFIPNGITYINMLFSFVIYGFFALAIYNFF
jgi:hypothetical protein